MTFFKPRFLKDLVLGEIYKIPSQERVTLICGDDLEVLNNYYYGNEKVTLLSGEHGTSSIYLVYLGVRRIEDMYFIKVLNLSDGKVCNMPANKWYVKANKTAKLFIKIS
jgi:hypothetical protein